jgi:3-oxoacyl-[acyl-carrier protein] reductase
MTLLIMRSGNRMRLNGKVAIITGAGAGIGKETALLFSREGAKIVIADIDEKSGKETEALIKKTGEGFFFKLDVTNREQIKSMVEETLRKYSRIDILINNAGIVSDARIIKMTEVQWDRVININLKGVFNCIQAVVNIMIEQGEGAIINASSVVGLYGNFGQTNYAATKAGVIGMTKALAKELARKGVRVNAVAPGYTMTRMMDNVPEKILQKMRDKTPLGRLAQPIDIAYAYLYLASDEAKYVNGAVLSVDGGLTL